MAKRMLGHIFTKQGGWTAAAIVGSAVIGAAGSAKAGGEARKGTEAASDAQLEAARIADERLRPYSDAGQQVLNPLLDSALGRDEWLQKEGLRTIQNSRAAQGLLGSGGTLTAMGDYLKGLEDQRFNRLFDMARLGGNAAAGQATNAMQTGTNLSNIALQGANAQGAMWSGIANAGQNALGNYLFLRGTGG